MIQKLQLCKISDYKLILYAERRFLYNWCGDTVKQKTKQ